jgi:hypothetical protein
MGRTGGRKWMLEKSQRQRFENPDANLTAVQVAEKRASIYAHIKPGKVARAAEVSGIVSDIWINMADARPDSKPGQTVMRLQRILKQRWGLDLKRWISTKFTNAENMEKAQDKLNRLMRLMGRQLGHGIHIVDKSIEAHMGNTIR